MAIPPAKIRAGRCYSGEKGMDRRVVSIEGERVTFETRQANSGEPWAKARTQALKALARLLHDEIDCESGELINRDE